MTHADLVPMLEEMGRREQAFASWVRARKLAARLYPAFYSAMRAHMRAEDLSEEDFQREWRKYKQAKAADDSGVASTNTDAEKRRYATWKQAFVQSFEEHTCSPDCLRVVGGSTSIYCCVYVGHMHVCGQGHCEQLRDTAEGATCPHSGVSAVELGEEFDRNPREFLRKQGKSSTRICAGSGLTREQAAQMSEESLLFGRFALMVSKRLVNPAPRPQFVTPPPSHGFRFLEKPSRPSTPTSRPPTSALMDHREQTKVFLEIKQRWLTFPGRENADAECKDMDAFIYALLRELKGWAIDPNYEALPSLAVVRAWLHPPTEAARPAPVDLQSTVRRRIARQLTTCRFDRRNASAGDGLDI